MSDEKQCPQCGRPIPPDAPGGLCPVCVLTGVQTAGDSAVWSSTSRDANLLFALFGHLLGYLNTEQFTEAIRNWTDNPSITIAEQLVARGVISKASRDYLEALILHTLEYHEGNVTKTLESLGGHERVATILKTSADASSRDLVNTRLALKIPGNLLEDAPAEEVTVAEKRGRYTGSSEYSRGGMGRILLVHDELLARDIALKELLPPTDEYQSTVGREDSPMRQSAALIARFLREARITGRLEHPSIVPVYELGRRENGSLYYTMRLVRGKTLRTKLQECKSLEDRLKLLPNFVDLCMGIAYAHSRGVVHRDIKPSNIMIGEFGETVIIDWGLAKVVSQREEGHVVPDDTLHRLHGDSAVGPDKTMTGEVLGSPHYMSPEQAGGLVDEIDARSDVFSLGVLLYEILADHAAFDKSSLDALIEQIRHEDPMPIAQREPHVPKELASICYRAIQKDKADRYSSAKQMGEDVSGFLQGSIVSAYTYTAAERIKRFYAQRRALVNVSAAAVAAIFVISIFAFVNITRSRDRAIAARASESIAREQAQGEKYLAEIRLVQSYIDSNQPVAAEQTLWKIDSERRNWEWGFLLNLSRPALARIEGYTVAAISPDGQRVVAASPDRPMAVLSLPKGEVLREFPGTQALVLFFTFSKDGKRILTGSRNTTAAIWDAETGLVLTTFSGHHREVQTANFTPDETRVITTVSGQPFENSVGVWDVATAQSLAMLQPGLGLSGAVASGDGKRLAVWLTDSPRTEPEVQLWSLENFQMLWKHPGNRPAFVPGTSNVLYISGSLIVVADVESGNEIARLDGHGVALTRIATTPDGNYAISGARDGAISIWDLRTRALRAENLQSDAIGLIAINSTGTQFATTSLSGHVSAWEIPTAVAAATVLGHNELITRIGFGPNDLLLTSSRDRSVSLWNARTSPGLTKIRRASPVVEVSASNAHEIVLAEAGGMAAVLETHTYDPVEEFQSPSWAGAVTKTVLTQDGRNALLLLDGFTVILWDRQEHRVLGRLDGHKGQIKDFAIDENGEIAVTAGWDGRVKFWNLDANQLSAEADVSANSLGAVCLAPDGKTAIVGAEDGVVHIFDAATGAELRSIHAHDGSVTMLALDPSGTLLASSSTDKHAKVWRLPDLTLEIDLAGHANAVQSVGFSSDSSRVFTVAPQDSLRVWDRHLGVELAHSSVLSMASIYPFGHSVLGAADDGVYIWEAAPYSPLQSRNEEYARFDTYRADMFEKPAEKLQREKPLPKTFFLSIASANRCIQLLREAIAQESANASPADAGGFPVPTTLARQAQVVLGLVPGDQLIRVRGEQTLSREVLDARLSMIAQTLTTDSPPMFTLEVRHAGEYREFRYVALAVKETRESVSISRSEAAERIARIVNLIKTNKSIAGEWTSRAKSIGIEVASGSIAGIFTSEQKGKLERNDFLALGIGPPDRITHFDGVAITRLDALLQQWDTLVADLQAGRRDQITLSVERGELQRAEITVTFN